MNQKTKDNIITEQETVEHLAQDENPNQAQQNHNQHNDFDDTQNTRDSILKERGTVVEVDSLFAYVVTTRSTGCGGCSSASGCGTSSLAKLFSGKSGAPIKVLKILPCKVGDEVELWLDESRLLKHSFMAYGLPLIGMFLVAIAVQEMAVGMWGLAESSAEIFAVLGALLGLFAGWKITKRFYQPELPIIGKILKSA